MRRRRSFTKACIIGLLAALPFAAAARGADDLPQTLVHMLGYIGVDYPVTVRNGRVVNRAEYAEQQEFARRARELIRNLPPRADKPVLARQASTLIRLIDERVPGPKVSTLTDEMRERLVKAYKIASAPRRTPDLGAARRAYEATCARCHGAEGYGDGPAAVGLDPRPSDFHDASRQSRRSIFSLYNTITLGVEGTAMRGYHELDNDQRWGLAFYVSNFFADRPDRDEGAVLWGDPESRSWFPDISIVAQTSPVDAEAKFGSQGRALLAYLRSDPGAIMQAAERPLAVSKRKLKESLEQYRAGNAEGAYNLAVTAYLEGFELAESALATADPQLKDTIEKDMYQYRGMIKAGEPAAAIAAQADSILDSLDTAQAALEDSQLTSGVAFTGALIILLREGLEAILVLAAIAAFLLKTDRRDALPYLHVGWVAALALGFVTWIVATYFIDVSGASRELTEGITALIAAGILLYVGVWLHSKLQVDRWSAFIKRKIERAMNGRTLWALALLAFIAVYREVFETVLFYQALWVQAGPSGHTMVLGGFLLAAAGLVVLAWLIFRFSAKLPLRLFFGVNSALMYLLAVVFAGKGVAALQEAGRLPINAIEFPRIDLLGIYPNLEALGAQFALVTIAIVFVILNRRSRRVRQ